MMLVGFLMNAFLSGGLFDSLKESSGKFSTAEFFRTSSKNFWSFSIISFIISLIIFLLGIILIVVPVSLVSQAEIPSEGAAFKTGIIGIAIFLLLLVALLLVADYARAWQVSNEKKNCFRAIGFGFRQVFRTFLSSYRLMLVLLIVQLLYGWLVLTVLPGIKPATAGGIVLLFLVAQLLFLIKILLKTWRYGSVTKMMASNL
jgi:hypothetical protein